MKYIISILFILFLNNCLGQRFDCKCKIIEVGQIIKEGTGFSIRHWYFDCKNCNTPAMLVKEYQNNDKALSEYYFAGWPISELYQIQQDSTKYYWKKYNYYKHRMNVELERINKFQNPTITKDLFRYEDSTKKYHELLNRLKSK